MAETYRIDSYSVSLYSSRQDGSVLVTLYLENGKMVLINFKDEDSNLPLPARARDGSRYKLFTSISLLPTYVDILRNENPVFFHYPDSGPNACISTLQEPVGEGEADEL